MERRYTFSWGGTGFCLMSWQQGKTVFPFSGKPAVYRVCIREHPEERERSILCRVALLGEVEQDTVTGCPRNHLFLAYFPKDSATVTLCRGDELLVSTRLAPPANNGNPDEFDYARYLRRKGYSGTATWLTDIGGRRGMMPPALSARWHWIIGRK